MNWIEFLNDQPYIPDLNKSTLTLIKDITYIVWKCQFFHFWLIFFPHVLYAKFRTTTYTKITDIHVPRSDHNHFKYIHS